MQVIDWAKLQSFVAVAEHGSLSAAARAAGASQPTLSRHISTLEEEIGLRLFDRTSEGLTLTAAGAEIYANAQSMTEAANQIGLIASGRSQEVRGTVRLSVSDTVAYLVIPPMLAALRRAEPQISIELVASNETHNLLKREADIAVRMFRPTQNDVITRKVGVLNMGFFASTAYLDQRGRPQRLQDALAHDFIGFDTNDSLIHGFRDRGLPVDRNFFPIRTDAFFTHLALVKSGCGIGILHADSARATPGIEQVLPEAPIPGLEFWLTAHVELRTSPRIRRVYDFLADRISELYG
jgi:DNA-binding transcriptional LysR family regulator